MGRPDSFGRQRIQTQPALHALAAGMCAKLVAPLLEEAASVGGDCGEGRGAGGKLEKKRKRKSPPAGAAPLNQRASATNAQRGGAQRRTRSLDGASVLANTLRIIKTRP